MNIVETIKENPVPIGVGVLALFMLMAFSGRSGAVQVQSDNSGTLLNASLQSQQIATQGNVSIAGINAGVQTAAMQSATTRAALTADMYKAGVGASVATHGADMSAFISSLSFMANQNQSNNQAQTSQLNSILGAASASKAMDTQLKIVQSNNSLNNDINSRSFYLNQLVQSDNYALKNKQIDNAYVLDSTGMSNDFNFSNAHYADILANQQALAKIQTDSNLAITNANNQTLLLGMLMANSKSIGQGVSSAASGVGSGIGSILNGVGGLFGGGNSGSDGGLGSIMNIFGGGNSGGGSSNFLSGYSGSTSSAAFDSNIGNSAADLWGGG